MLTFHFKFFYRTEEKQIAETIYPIFAIQKKARSLKLNGSKSIYTSRIRRFDPSTTNEKAFTP
jgi:hypothetical protein